MCTFNVWSNQLAWCIFLCILNINLNFSEFSIKEEDGRISLAYERLPGIPKNIADKFALRTHTLDLSYNTIRWMTINSVNKNWAAENEWVNCRDSCWMGSSFLAIWFCTDLCLFFEFPNKIIVCFARRDLIFLANFKNLHTLILDNNVSIDVNTLPILPSLRILWLNKCGVNQLQKFLRHINICAPNIRQLSLMGNPCARTLLNGSPPIENNNYM